MLRIAVAVLAVAALASTASAQQTDTLELDTRCAVVGLAMAGMPSATPQQRQGGTLLAMYYIGRVQGRAPTQDLETALRAQATTMAQAAVQAESMRCGTEFRVIGQTLTDIGQRLSAPQASQP